MENRVQKQWDEIKQWKQLALAGLSEGVVNSDTFRREELRKYRSLLSEPLISATREERFARKLLKRESRELEKALYPNSRLIVNFFRFLGAIVKAGVDVYSFDTPKQRQLNTVANQLGRLGIAYKDDILNDIRNGRVKFDLTQSTILNASDRLEYKVEIVKNDDNHAAVKGCLVTLHADGKDPLKLYVVAEGKMTVGQAEKLLQGKALNIGGDRWLIPDMNDRDALGGIAIKEVQVPGFSVWDEIAKLPRHLPGLQMGIDEMTHRLKNGEKVNVELAVGNHTKGVVVEVNPLTRTLVMHDRDTNEKTSLQKILQQEEAQKKEPTIKQEVVKQQATKAQNKKVLANKTNPTLKKVKGGVKF